MGSIEQQRTELRGSEAKLERESPQNRGRLLAPGSDLGRISVGCSRRLLTDQQPWRSLWSTARPCMRWVWLWSGSLDEGSPVESSLWNLLPSEIKSKPQCLECSVGAGARTRPDVLSYLYGNSICSAHRPPLSFFSSPTRCRSTWTRFPFFERLRRAVGPRSILRAHQGEAFDNGHQTGYFPEHPPHEHCSQARETVQGMNDTFKQSLPTGDDPIFQNLDAHLASHGVLRKRPCTMRTSGRRRELPTSDAEPTQAGDRTRHASQKSRLCI